MLGCRATLFDVEYRFDLPLPPPSSDTRVRGMRLKVSTGRIVRAIAGWSRPTAKTAINRNEQIPGQLCNMQIMKVPRKMKFGRAQCAHHAQESHILDWSRYSLSSCRGSSFAIHSLIKDCLATQILTIVPCRPASRFRGYRNIVEICLNFIWANMFQFIWLTIDSSWIDWRTFNWRLISTDSIKDHSSEDWYEWMELKNVKLIIGKFKWIKFRTIQLVIDMSKFGWFNRRVFYYSELQLVSQLVSRLWIIFIHVHISLEDASDWYQSSNKQRIFQIYPALCMLQNLKKILLPFLSRSASPLVSLLEQNYSRLKLLSLSSAISFLPMLRRDRKTPTPRRRSSLHTVYTSKLYSSFSEKSRRVCGSPIETRALAVGFLLLFSFASRVADKLERNELIARLKREGPRSLCVRLHVKFHDDR